MFEESKLFAESCNVAWRKKPSGGILSDCKTEFIVLKNGFRYWAADPFIFEYNNEVYIFAELYDYIKRRGVLGYYKLEGKSRGKWKPIIVEDYHMSYPNIFRMGDEVFIMPESNACSELYMYRAVKFPDKWEKCNKLRIGVEYADTTPFEWNGEKKALTYRVTDPYHPELLLLDLEDCTHDRKLELPNVERRRSAGNVFEYKGKRIRPAQDCVEDYGTGIIFYEYGMTSNGEYYEDEVLELKPEQLVLSHTLYLTGMHTYNCTENYEVIDIKTRRFNLLNFIFRLVGKVL